MKIHWCCGIWPQLCSRHLMSSKVILWVCSQLPGVRLVPRYWVHIHSHALSRPVTLFYKLLWIAMEGTEPHTLFSWHWMMANLACWLARWHSWGAAEVYLMPIFWQKVSLRVRHRENISTAQQVTGIFYRKKKMLFTLPTESRLSLLLGEECLYSHGKRERLWKWAENVFRCFVI